jgi:hypothetical protein
MLILENKFQKKTSQDNKPVLETIAERVRRHLRDKKSVITEDDIRNARMVWDTKDNEYEDFLALYE